MSASATQGGHNKLKPGLVALTTSGLEMDRAYSYFGTS